MIFDFGKKDNYFMKQYIKTFLTLCTILAIFLIFHSTNLSYYVSLTYFQQQAYYLYAWVHAHYVLSVLLYIAFYICYVTLSLPAAALLTLASGYLYGSFWGAIYTNIGITLGSTCSFLIFRYAFGHSMLCTYESQFQKFYHFLSVYGVWYLLFMRLIMIVPLFVANALMSMAPVSIGAFMWTTSLGTIPVTIIYTMAGEQLYMLRTIYDVFSWKIIGILLIFKLVILMVAGIIFYAKKRI